ncbi:hypothetical protein C0J52_15267 [Blattella germanica]|nr:hypothetical protein C0J52_15267 [Blattella germanica]
MAINMGIVNTEKRIDTQACSKHSQHIYASTYFTRDMIDMSQPAQRGFNMTY